ncbi:hypothetical protein TRFO_25840 [Tritrichomonas foetus]|uniref:Uncharacterized protein n=1 Tax=Tritrichomonas foetus TaxID=1144522 RepID=A0A1J4K924_9EUKA|nr:hypothetical protein TRFO_25840 [Tritrichomonas foetus]|eukprot:OHT06212.1 hypothetical protein TRFO_25840 [Tritrichomonas foetus]
MCTFKIHKKSFFDRMSKKGTLLRLQLDQSFLDSSFQTINTKIERHEEMILELQKLLKEVPGRDDLLTFRDRILDEVTLKTDRLNEKIDDLEKRMDKKMKDLEDSFEARILDTANMLNLQIRNKFEEVNKSPTNNNINSKFAEMEEKIGTLENNLFFASKKLQTTRDCVKKVASSIGLFNNNKNIKLDISLFDNLKGSVSYVKDDMKSIHDEIEELKEKIANQAEIQSQNKKAAHNDLIEVIQEVQQDHTSSNMPGKTSEFDITSIRPYPSMVAHWRDPPELPIIHQFLTIGEVVDYIYRIVPKLQAHMTAMQGKIVENATEIQNRVERPLLEKIFEKFQSVIGDMSKRMNELKEGYDQTASRGEINTMVEDIFRAMTKESQTSVGRLKCMACGRDIPQVVGAMSEEEASEMLGPATSSHVFHVKSGAVSNASNNPSVGVRYADTEGFNSEIVESPLSYRPAKVSRIPSQNSTKPK